MLHRDINLAHSHFALIVVTLLFPQAPFTLAIIHTRPINWHWDTHLAYLLWRLHTWPVNVFVTRLYLWMSTISSWCLFIIFQLVNISFYKVSNYSISLINVKHFVKSILWSNYHGLVTWSLCGTEIIVTANFMSNSENPQCTVYKFCQLCLLLLSNTYSVTIVQNIITRCLNKN